MDGTRAWARRAPEVASCSALDVGELHGLDVPVFDGVHAFARWLAPEAALPEVSPRRAPAVNHPDAVVLQHLFPERATLALLPLAGNLLGVRSPGSAPAIAVVGDHVAVATERAAWARVAGALGEHAPTLVGWVEHGERAGLRFAYPGMGAARLRTLAHDPTEEALDTLFLDVLGPLAAASRVVEGSLAAAAGLPARLAAARARAGDEVLPALSPPERPGETWRAALTHGELGADRVLVDEAGRVWVLGFTAFATRPVLTDLARLERDLLARGAEPSPAFDRLADRLHRGDAGEAWLVARLCAALDADAWDDAAHVSPGSSTPAGSASGCSRSSGSPAGSASRAAPAVAIAGARWTTTSRRSRRPA